MIRLPDHMPNKNQLPILEHYLYGKQIRNKETGKVSDVDLVWAEKSIDGGWVISVMFSDEVPSGGRSHGIIHWQNISVRDVSWKAYIKETRAKFEVL